MSHELRTPMNAIIGYAELALEEADDVDPQDLMRIRDAGTYLLGLVNDILDLSKVDAQAMVFVSETVDVVDVVRQAGMAADLAIQKRNNELILDVPGPTLAVADPLRLRQCLLNLLSNAARFTTNGRITLRVRAEPHAVYIDVEDDGEGIAQEHLSRIFEPFHQATDRIERTHGGTGLGLSLVQQFVHGMGGEVHVESEFGGGSTFTIMLPPAEGGLSAP